MKKAMILLIAGLVMFIVSCAERSTGDEVADEINQSLREGTNVVVNNDEGSLNERVTIVNNELLGGERTVPPLIWIASVDAPFVGDDQVQACFAYLDPCVCKAYIGYNTEGEEWRGGVEIVSLSNVYHPVVVSQALFNDTDVQAVAADFQNTGRFWMASAIDPDPYGLNSPAVIEEVILSSSGKFPSPYTSHLYDVPSSVAKGVRRSANWLYSTTSRTDGGAFCHSLNSSNYMEIVEEDRYDNAKGIAITGNQIHSDHLVLEAGEQSNLHIYDVGSTDSDHEPIIYNIGLAAPYYAKLWCDLKDNVAYVAMGEGGFKAFDVSAGADNTEPDPMFYFNRPGNGLTNAVTVDNDYIYVANGEDGLYVFARPTGTPTNQELTPIAQFDFNGSVNFVKAYNEWIFVAAGSGGLHILYRSF